VRLQLEYGENAWREVVRLARCKWYVFNTHHIYPDGLMPELATAAAHLLTDPDRTPDGGRAAAEPTADVFMRYFGRCFVRFFSNLGYDAPIRATGRYFCEFLKNVDNLHLQMRFAYPKMKSPSMYMSHVDRNGCVLVYRSTRRGFTQYFMGEQPLPLTVTTVKTVENTRDRASVERLAAVRLLFDRHFRASVKRFPPKSSV